MNELQSLKKGYLSISSWYDSDHLYSNMLLFSFPTIGQRHSLRNPKASQQSCYVNITRCFLVVVISHMFIFHGSLHFFNKSVLILLYIKSSPSHLSRVSINKASQTFNANNITVFKIQHIIVSHVSNDAKIKKKCIHFIFIDRCLCSNKANQPSSRNCFWL